MSDRILIFRFPKFSDSVYIVKIGTRTRLKVGCSGNIFLFDICSMMISMMEWGHKCTDFQDKNDLFFSSRVSRISHTLWMRVGRTSPWETMKYSSRSRCTISPTSSRLILNSDSLIAQYSLVDQICEISLWSERSRPFLLIFDKFENLNQPKQLSVVVIMIRMSFLYIRAKNTKISHLSWIWKGQSYALVVQRVWRLWGGWHLWAQIGEKEREYRSNVWEPCRFS